MWQEIEVLLNSWHLNNPSIIWRIHFVFYGPFRQRVPFVIFAAVDGQSQLRVGIFAFFQVRSYFLLVLEKQMQFKIADRADRKKVKIS